MKKLQPLLCFLFLLVLKNSVGQILCIKSYRQDDPISYGVNNLLLNGGFENNNCNPGTCQFCGNSTSFCPNSSNNHCNIINWTASGGGGYSFANTVDTNTSGKVVEGNIALQFENGFCNPCSPIGNDVSCLFDSANVVSGVPNGYPTNAPIWGGNTGVSIEQTVTGLVAGNTYILEFWVGGDQSGYYYYDGLFAVDAGFGNLMLRCTGTRPFDIGKRYLIEFKAVSTTHTIKFTSWGHPTYNSTELTLDDVRLYTLAELTPFVPPCSYQFTAHAGSTNTTCGQCNGSAHAIIVHGTAPFTFLWSTLDTSQALSGLCAGTYRVTITDANNISDFASTIISPSTSMAPVTIQAPKAEICASDSTEICVVGNFQSYLWSTGATTQCIQTSLAGNYYATAFNNTGCSRQSNHLSITVHTLITVAISVNGDTLTTYGADTYQWYRNGVAINGATAEMYVVTQGGNYVVQLIDSNSCSAFSSPVVFSGIETLYLHTIAITPNPVIAELKIQIDETIIGAQLNIYDITGALIQTGTLQAQNTILNTSNYASGVYIAELKTKEESVKKRWMKM